jgi:hypothetical protein
MRLSDSRKNIHNPFQNRFNYPVTRRLDEMQAAEYMLWLRQRNDGGDLQRRTSNLVGSRNIRGTFASVLALLVLVVSLVVVLKLV